MMSQGDKFHFTFEEIKSRWGRNRPRSTCETGDRSNQEPQSLMPSNALHCLLCSLSFSSNIIFIHLTPVAQRHINSFNP